MWSPPWMTCIVNDGQNLKQIILDRVENAIRKPWQECAADILDNFRVQEWSLFKELKLKFKSQFKFRVKPFTLFLIPIERFTDCAKDPTGKLQAVRHEPLFKCALT